MNQVLIFLTLFTVNSVTTEFDERIKYSANKYLPQWHWTWYKAQLYQESLLNPTAVSRSGAGGIAQFMPETCKEEFARLGYQCNAFDADKSIVAGASYMKRLRRIFRAKRPEYDRRRWALASYNRGIGNILNDQKTCGNNLLWIDTVPCVPKQETINYVELIEKHWFDFYFRNK